MSMGDGIRAGMAYVEGVFRDAQELHHEKVGFLPHVAQGLSDKAVEIIRAAEANDLPPRIAANSDFYLCRFCPFHSTCWEGQS